MRETPPTTLHSKEGPSENMIGNFRHNLHIISIKIDTAVTPVVFDASLKFTESCGDLGSLLARSRRGGGREGRRGEGGLK